ncbi:MAG: hypothetical protein RL417_672 [Pseudomonadota bacterium]
MELLKGNPLVLIVDDDELMREVCSVMISEAGGKVVTAVDGVDGVERFAEDPKAIRCVVMDYSMPRMNGVETFIGMQRMNPDLKCIMVSGLLPTPEVEELCKTGELLFLRKPFRAEELVSALNRVINSAA